MTQLLFFIQVFVISFSGAMQPGPVTATAIVLGSRSRYAGLALALGHVLVEFPLMILIMLGMGIIFKSPLVQIIIGLAGGTILIIMAIQMAGNLRNQETPEPKGLSKKPIRAGAVLSIANPYFLLWWSTIGLALATGAREFGIWAFAIFALVHWLTDCLWLYALSWASFKGTKLFSQKVQRIILGICSAALLAFGVIFIYNSFYGLIRFLR
ncbi:MAG: LysE family transporter [Sedimentisphaerales bacterium]|nr:LysE family transporter [Sedimentisphaerales bacterium]